ncbi:MAG TPA: YfdX family protein, partial [Nitrospiraceae bacterium]|nr:YfdX family protein [Nitrospiraceae bacterium]
VQPKVDKQTADAAEEKRKKLVADATAALAETHKALKALENKKNDAALKALAEVMGKLDLIVARDPKLAQVPVETEVVTYDLLTDLDTIKKITKDAKAYLNNGEIQKARPLVANLASEIQYRTHHIPLATYPTAIKAIAPLIDAGKIDEAKASLQATLNTLVVTTDDVIPLPKLRAEHLLKQAQELTEKKDRSKEENDKLAKQLQAAREQLQMAELLGYGKKTDFTALYEQISEIENKSAGGKSGTGWFDKLKQQLTDLF